MKNQLFLLLLFALWASCLFADDNLYFSEGMKWYGVSVYTSPYVGTSYHSVFYYIQGDTVIGSIQYQVFRNEKGECCAALRHSEDGQEVYIYPLENLLNDPWWEQGEHLLYKFNVEIGETVYAFDGSYSGTDDMGTDKTTQYKWIVKDVHTINGRKHVFVEGGQMKHQVEWIEGIGTPYILFENNFEDEMCGNYSTYALCAVNENGNVLYSFDTDHLGIHNEQCEWKPMAIDNVKPNTSSATRVLRNGHLYIQRGGKTYNSNGALVGQFVVQ